MKVHCTPNSLLTTLLLSVDTSMFADEKESVLLSDINALTFYKGQKTKAHRGKAIPQLTCHGPPCGKHEPEVVQCKNVGDSGKGDYQWKCSAELDSSVKFGPVNVNCEGYAYPDDPYVTKGSCGLAYTLVWTGDGSEGKHRAEFRTDPKKGGFFSSWIPMGVIAFLLAYCWRR